MTAFSEAAARVAAGADAASEATELVAQMELAEKLWCLDGDIPFWPGIVDLGNGGYNEHPFRAARVDRLGIPGLDFADGPRGCVVGPCTVFPVSMARGASFDPDLERRVGAAIGAELRAQGATFTGAVCMNLLRHPAWGRAQETYGEDPHHVGAMASALTAGLQEHVMACMKHFALNSMENARFRVDVAVDERALHEVYLPHFKRVAEAGVASVMSAYNSVNGEWCGENATLLETVLRDEWGFEGFAITDFSFGLRDPVKSVTAGCNIEMPFRQQRAVALEEAVESGALAIEAVEHRVVETLATFLRFAWVYEKQPTSDVIACKAHRQLAREAANAAIVLVRNEAPSGDAGRRAPLLPLDIGSLGRVAVLGRLADLANLGDGGSSNVLQPDVVTPLAGIRAALTGVEVVHAESDVAITRDADLVVVVVGYTKEHEGEFLDQTELRSLAHLFPPVDHPELGMKAEGSGADDRRATRAARQGTPNDALFAMSGDRDSLRLLPEDEALIRAAAAAHHRVVVAVIAGSAVVMPWLEEVPAALMLWYAGMEGGHALADVLLGRSEPGGRLPFAVPRDEADLVHFDRDASRETYGLLHGQWWLDHRGIDAHLPFGFGLGYTRFELSDAAIEAAGASATVRNTGDRPGSTVVQLYGSVAGSHFERPARRLVGFARVALPAGQSERLTIPADMAALDVRVDGAWLREALPVTFAIGLDARSAVEIELTSSS